LHLINVTEVYERTIILYRLKAKSMGLDEKFKTSFTMVYSNRTPAQTW